MSKPHNIAALLFFYPGAGVTMMNVEEASKAAKDRSLHLNKLKENKTIISVSHKNSTLIDCEKIISFKGGKIIS